MRREWTERIAAEYDETPGLRLTLVEAARRFRLDTDSCAALFNEMLDKGLLTRTPDDRYCWSKPDPTTLRPPHHALNTEVRIPAGLPPRLARLARRRLWFVMRRFLDRVRSLTVRLEDTNGPRGGVDKRCVVTVWLANSRRPVIVGDTNQDAAAALHRAADRAARAVARTLGATRYRSR